MSGEMVRVEARPVVRAVMPQGLGDLWKFAEAAAKSRLYGVTTTEAAFMVLQTGMELGLMPTQALRGIYIVQNRPMLSADLCVAIVQSDARCDYWRTLESTTTSCTIETRRKGSPEPTRKTWTEADAKRADLHGKGTWKQYPAQMLRHRCAMDLAREVYPDLLLGLYTPAEFDDAREMTAEPTEPRPTELPSAQTDPLTVEHAAAQWVARQQDGSDAEELMECFESLHRQCPAGTSKAALKRAIAAETERRKPAPVAAVEPKPEPANDAMPVTIPVTGKATGKVDDPGALATFKATVDGAETCESVVAAWRQHRPALAASNAIDAAKRYAIEAVAAKRGKGEMDATNWLSAQLNGDGPKPRGGRKPAPAAAPVDADGSGEHAVAAPDGSIASLRVHLMRHCETYAVGASWAKHQHRYADQHAAARAVVVDRLVALGADESTAGALLDATVADYWQRQSARRARTEAA